MNYDSLLVNPLPFDTLRGAALWYASFGIPVIPLAGKIPATGLGSNGVHDATTDVPQIERWFADPTVTGVGLALGAASNLTVVDVDGPKGRETIASLGLDLSAAAWVAESGREDGGTHYYFQGAFPQWNASKTLGLDFKSTGGYIVAPPSIHPDTIKQYRWSKFDPKPAFTPVPANIINKPLPRGANSPASLLPVGTLEPYSNEEALKLWAAMETIPGADYNEWISVGMGCHWVGRFWGSDIMLKTWNHWSSLRPNYKGEAEIIKKWASFGKRERDNITVATIFYLAKKYGYILTPADAETIRAVELAKMNETHFVLGNYGGRCLIGEFAENDVGDLNLEYQSKQHFFDRYSNRRVPSVGKNSAGETVIVWQELAKAWFNTSDRRQYRGVGLDPNCAGEVLPNGNLNLWRGFGIEPKFGDWSLLRTHIIDVVANGDDTSARYILAWIAWVLQNPGERPEVALVLQGEKGCGKSVLLSGVRSIFGTHGKDLAREDHLTGKFNSRFQYLLYVFADEAVWAGDRKGEGVLKALITNETIEIEPKGIDSRTTRNRLAIAMAANAAWVVPASKDERRYAVFGCSDKFSKGKCSEAHRAAYFKPLWQKIENGGLAAMFHDLLQMDLTNWHPRYNIPETKALRDQKLETLGVYDQFVYRLLQDGALPINKFKANNECSNDALWAYLQRGVKTNVHATEDGLGKHLKNMFKCKPVKHGVRGWQFPSLATMREDWDRNYGKHDEWLGGPEWEDRGAQFNFTQS